MWFIAISPVLFLSLYNRQFALVNRTFFNHVCAGVITLSLLLVVIVIARRYYLC